LFRLLFPMVSIRSGKILPAKDVNKERQYADNRRRYARG
jgi:hypothetical protein